MKTFTPNEVAEILAVDPDKVRLWIRNGELRGFDVGQNPNSKKPRYRVSEKSLEAFQEQRSIVPITSRPRRRQRKKDSDFVKYY
ncbi:MAG: helix-turn-helix domain-containing protein [Planctomycetes bacterium]|nr:helix-turn-helix domain-containing protein [Planctomycetota bacterium]